MSCEIQNSGNTAMNKTVPVLVALTLSRGQAINQHVSNYSQSNYYIIRITSKSREAERMGLSTEL